MWISRDPELFGTGNVECLGKIEHERTGELIFGCNSDSRPSSCGAGFYVLSGSIRCHSD